MVSAVSSLFATTIWTEDFDIPPFIVDTNVVGIDGWESHSGTTGPFLATASSLTYANYSSPGEGGACSNVVTGSYDINKTFTAVTSGDLYAGFLINANPTGTTADYAIHFGTPPSSFYGRIWFQKDAILPKYRVGIIKNTPGTENINIVWSGYDYDPGTTYLYILKYTFAPGDLNDEVRLWINPPTPGTETAATLTCISTAETGADPTSLGAFMLRQGSFTPPYTVDAIKLGTTWNDVYPAVVVTGAIDTGTTTSLTFNTLVGTPQIQTFKVTGYDLGSNITITAPTDYLLYADESPSWASSIEVSSATQTISVKYTPVAPGHFTTDVISLTAVNADPVYLTLDATATTVASIIVNPTSRTFSTTAGTTSAYQSYTLTGTNLTGDIVITAPAGYQVCDTADGTYLSSISVAATYNGSIYVHFTPIGYGTNDGVVTHVADGLTTSLNVYGTGTGTPLNIAVNTTLRENFDYMGVTFPIATYGTNLPQDWRADKNTTVRFVGSYASALTATDVSRVGGDNLSTTAGNGVYNFGAGDYLAATDRSVGFLSSSSATKSGNLYAKLTNTGVDAITALEISYNAEKFRKGINVVGFSIQMYYSLDGVAWTNAGTNFITSFAGGDADNTGYSPSPGATMAVTNALLPVNVPAAGNVYLAWNYAVTSGTTTSNAQALAIDDVVITGRALDIVAVPTFDPTPGIVYSGSQLVTINCATAGASIRYTTDGVTEPTATVGTLYTGPFSISATTTIKAVGYKTGWVDSAVQTGTYTFPINVANIAALRAGTVGLIPYRLTGEAILTLQSSVTTGSPSVTTKNKYIQDATGAIQIYDPNPPKMTTSYNLGDGITGIVGTLTNYGQMLEFVPLLDAGAPTSIGNVVTPTIVTLAALDASYQAKLIHVTNVSIDPAAVSPFTASTNYVITDQSGAGVLRTAYADLDYIGAAFTNSPMDYTGICLQYNTAFQLVPRSLAEIAPSSEIISSDTDTLDFGYVDMNFTATKTLTLSNQGYRNLDVFSIVPLSNNFTVTVPGGLPLTLTTGQSKIIMVSFTPSAVQNYDYNMNIISSDPTNSNTKVIKLSGYGYNFVCDFNAGPLSGEVPLPVQFTSQSSPTVTNWEWDFGDGEFSSEINPQHTYEARGNYTVSLTVNDGWSDKTCIKTSYISAVAFPRIQMDTLKVLFPITYIGAQSANYQLRIQNVGNYLMNFTDEHLWNGNSSFHFDASELSQPLAPGQSCMVNIYFEPHSTGLIRDSLVIISDAHNKSTVVIGLAGTATYAPPSPPQNLVIDMVGNDAHLSWDAVTTNVLDVPITPDCYVVLFNGQGDTGLDSDYYYLWWTDTTNFVHSRVARYSSHMSYRVVAIKEYERSNIVEILNTFANRKEPVKWTELQKMIQ